MSGAVSRFRTGKAQHYTAKLFPPLTLPQREASWRRNARPTDHVSVAEHDFSQEKCTTP